MAVAVPSGTSICPRGRISEVFWGKLPKNSTKAVVPGDGEPASYHNYDELVHQTGVL